MNNTVDIINVSLDVNSFETGNDLSKDEFNKHGFKAGEFIISDGTEYTYSFNYGFTIIKKSDFIKIN